MQSSTTIESFISVAHCTSLLQVAELIQSSPSDSVLRKTAAAYGMVLVAGQAAQPNTYFKDALTMLNQLGHAKASLDAASAHEPAVAQITSSLLSVAQVFLADATIPCTEWPTTEEICSVVLREAIELGKAA
jgi:hypothetical protein